MQVILVSKPTIEALVPFLQQITQRSYNIQSLEDLLDLYAAIGGRNSLADRSVLRHLSFSFLCLAASDTIQESLERTYLDHIVFDTIRRGFTGAFISGTVANFKDAVGECCASHSTTDIRELYNQIYLLLQSAGLRRIWKAKTKKITDGTFSIIV